MKKNWLLWAFILAYILSFVGLWFHFGEALFFGLGLALVSFFGKKALDKNFFSILVSISLIYIVIVVIVLVTHSG